MVHTANFAQFIIKRILGRKIDLGQANQLRRSLHYLLQPKMSEVIDTNSDQFTGLESNLRLKLEERTCTMTHIVYCCQPRLLD